MQQISVGGVQLNEIETGFAGIGDGLAEIIHDTRDFMGFQRARHGGVNADRIAVFVT